MKTIQSRAKRGGEVGTNGEFYEGGKFLPSTEKPKGEPRKRGARKVQVAPYVWETLSPDDGRRPIFQIVGAQARWIDRFDAAQGIEPHPPGVAYYGDTYHGRKIADLCEAWNRGERWY